MEGTGAGETAQQVRAPTALSGDLGSTVVHRYTRRQNDSIHTISRIGKQLRRTLRSVSISRSHAVHPCPHEHIHHAHTCRDMHIHKMKMSFPYIGYHEETQRLRDAGRARGRKKWIVLGSVYPGLIGSTMPVAQDCLVGRESLNMVRTALKAGWCCRTSAQCIAKQGAARLQQCPWVL